MNSFVEWHLWSAETIAETLSTLTTEVESHIEALPQEHREKNRAALSALTTVHPTTAEIRAGIRERELMTIGFALDVLGRQAAIEGNVGRSMQLLQAAHELFRSGNPEIRPTAPMRQTVSNALRILVRHKVDCAVAGEPNTD